MTWCLSVCPQENDGGSCPFCRTEIKGTESVTIFPFEPDHADPKPLEDAMQRMSMSANAGNYRANQAFAAAAAAAAMNSDHSSSEVGVQLVL